MPIIILLVIRITFCAHLVVKAVEAALRTRRALLVIHVLALLAPAQLATDDDEGIVARTAGVGSRARLAVRHTLKALIG